MTVRLGLGKREALEAQSIWSWKYLLLGATGGWLITATVLALAGKANIGTELVGVMVAVLWVTYAALVLCCADGGAKDAAP